MDQSDQKSVTNPALAGDVAANFHQEGEPVNLSGDVNQRARLKSVGRDQANGEDALLNAEGESIPAENPGVGEKAD